MKLIKNKISLTFLHLVIKLGQLIKIISHSKRLTVNRFGCEFKGLDTIFAAFAPIFRLNCGPQRLLHKLSSFKGVFSVAR